MDVVWLNRFKLNRFETGLSASVNGAIVKYLCFSYSLDSENNLVSVLCCLVIVSIIKLVRKILVSVLVWLWFLLEC